MSPSLPFRGRCDVRNTSGPVELGAQHVRAAERLPHGVGAQQPAACARERARHVEVPLDVVGVRGDEVDRDAGAAEPLVLGDDLEAGVVSSSSASACAALPSFVARAWKLSGSSTVSASGAARRRRGRRRRVPSSRTRRRAMSTYVGIEVVADVAAAEPCRGDERRAGAHERVEHEIVLVRVEVDQAAGQPDRERRGMRDAARALGFDVPDVERRFHELVGVDRVLRRQAAALAIGAARARGRSGPCSR